MDLICSYVVLTLAAVFLARHALCGVRRETFPLRDGRRQTGDPLVDWASPVLVRTLSPVVDALIAAGVSANAVTGASLVAGLFAGGALALGHFGIAAFAIAIASLGDAVDGLLARRTRTASSAGALFDASVDRYEEFFVLGGLALYFRSNTGALALGLLAIAGSFMVSYGSAKAEAHGVRVPGGVLRRASRASLLAGGTTFVPIATAIARTLSAPAWAAYSPVLLVLALIAVGANASAILRLRAVACAMTSGPAVARARKEAPRESALRDVVVRADAAQ
jgi:CDP-diacylglycerol---glycerol-3-phosphate 3-phosphatidyltransferase